MNNFCDNRIFRPAEIKSKKKSIKRHSQLVRKEKAIKELRRRHSGGAKGHFVYNNNFLSRFKRAVGNIDVQSGTINSIVHELKAETAMEKPTDSVKYVIPQYASEENNE